MVDVLEREGVEKFEASWHELVDTVETALDDAKQGKEDPAAGANPKDPDDTVAYAAKSARGTQGVQ